MVSQTPRGGSAAQRSPPTNPIMSWLRWIATRLATWCCPIPGTGLELSGRVSDATLCPNYAFRAAAVPAGKHTVRFDFDPISYRRGKVISGTSLAAVAVLGVATILRRRNCRPEKALPASQSQPGVAHSEMTE